MAELLKVSNDLPEAPRIAYAASLIRAGQVVAIPTDTFYGLAADPFNLYAVEQIFQMKGRPAHKPLLLLVSSIEQAEELSANLPDRFYPLARRFWPGPLTIVVEASRRVPLKITGNTGKVAVRLPNAKIPVTLIRELDLPLTGTSANLAGLMECSGAAKVQEQLGDRLPLIVDGGDTRAMLRSTIVEVTRDDWRIIREGAIPADDIKEFFAE